MKVSSANSNLRRIALLIVLACTILVAIKVTNRDQAILTIEMRVQEGIEGEEYDSQLQQDGEEEQDSIEYAPIIINAGQGTTGTHLFTEATCLLGYTSLHYNLGCIPSTYIVPKTSNRTIPAETSIRIDSKFQSDIIGQHYFFLAKVSALNKIHFTNNGKSFLIRAQKVLEDLILNAKAMNILLSLHDTPYPFLLPYIIKFAKKHHDGKSPLISLSERDPEEYVLRRTSTNQGNLHIMCRQSLENGSSYHNSSFDILGCIERAVNNHEESSNLNKNGEDIGENQRIYTLSEENLLISMSNATKEFGIDKVVEAYREYQDSGRMLATFSYNIFNKKERTNVEDLASMMKEKFGRYYTPEKGLVNVNLLKKTLIEKII